MNSPKISVVMSVYNGMPYLKKAAMSILDQTFKDFEFIIVNDASTDDTSEYLKNLNDRRVKIIKNPKNIGVAESLNKALLIARGDYIARMDADDISLPNRLKTQLAYMEDHPEISLCGCWVELIDKSGKKIGTKEYPAKSENIKSALLKYNCIIHPTFFSKREFYQELKGYDPKFDFAEDYELLMRARDRFQMANVNKVLFKWRLWGERRSQQDMHIMDKMDFKIKLEAIKRDGLDTNRLLDVAKKYFMTYVLPLKIKLKMSKMLKLP